MAWDHRLEGDPMARNDALRQLIELGRIDGAAAGIARQIIAEGLGSLSERQAFVFRQIAIDHLLKEFPTCGEEIPLDELSRFALEGLCCRCALREVEEH
jgi:hypothetical protein